VEEEYEQEIERVAVEIIIIIITAVEIIIIIITAVEIIIIAVEVIIIAVEIMKNVSASPQKRKLVMSKYVLVRHSLIQYCSYVDAH